MYIAMSVKRSSIIYLALALVLGVAAAFLVQRWTAQRFADIQKKADGETTQVVVAAREIEFGTTIEATHLATVVWPATAIPVGSYHDVQEVVGKMSKYYILPGEPILAPRIADPRSGALLAGMIETNKRAVAVRVDDVVGVAGFLLPGSHVDVVASRRVDQDRYDTRTILTNLKVLAVDQTASAGGQDKPVVVRAVTLEADPAQAELLIKATREGSVQLALRNPGDHAVPQAVVSLERAQSARPVRRAPDQGESSASPITVIRGTHIGADPARR